MPRSRPLASVVCLLALLLLAPGIAEAQTAAAADRPRPQATAFPRSGPVALDGRLDEAAWAAATPVGEFTQQRPNEGAAPTERTEVRFLYDEEAIYIGARMYDSHGAAGVTSRLTRRDEFPNSDLLRVDFDPYHGRLHSVEFDVNPAGWRGDATDFDRSWDPVWDAATLVDSLGWTAEIRIPFGQLRFSRDSVQTWGLNLTRVIHRNQERDQWASWRENEPGGPAYFGDLTGLRIHRRPQQAEILPYVVGRAERLSSGNPRSPFYDPNRSRLSVGADLKYLLTSSFTLDATVNPDFGQVEVDPAVVNLSAFESYFAERRPFFVERSDVFRFGNPGCNMNCGLGISLFYSRRLGRTPQGSGLARAAGEYADIPQTTAILGAAKLTGRTRTGYNVGIVNAITRREVAEVQTVDGTRLFQTVEPLTNSFVGRVRREMKGGNLSVGGILTALNRGMDDPGLTRVLPSAAQTGGLDTEIFWGKRTYRFQAAVSGSRVAGDSLAILRLQRSSARYFQRPDRTISSDGPFSAALDPSSDALSGYGAIARLEKQGGNWIWDMNASMMSPGFETNDLGFLTSVDSRWLNGTFGRQFTRPTRHYRSLFLMGGGEQQWNYDGDLTGRGLSFFARTQLRNYWTATAYLSRRFVTLSDRLTRGGPVVGQPGNNFGFFSVSSDPRRRVLLNANLNASAEDDDAHQESLGLSATLRLASNARITFGPGYSRSLSTAQYVVAVNDPTATDFFGRRYVFANVQQRQLYMTTRANVTFTPALSLDLFAQPLLASADYHDFKEFSAPREQTKLVYGRDRGTITTTTATDGTRRYAVDPDGAGPLHASHARAQGDVDHVELRPGVGPEGVGQDRQRRGGLLAHVPEHVHVAGLAHHPHGGPADLDDFRVGEQVHCGDVVGHQALTEDWLEDAPEKWMAFRRADPEAAS
ncbi:MAG: carbohydrate binding family 9 domain-containing protein [Gemmatimonadetes bacterium]|nr:carbohydrate binding family 9 domain-containing protein [Gemmatimonadota bacterium]